MADTQKLVFLKEFAAGVSGVYSAIAKNINNVVAVLNVMESDSTISGHIKQIIASLELLKPKIVLEEGIATKEKLKPLLRILNRQLAEIKKLEAYLRISIKNPKHDVIKAINDLNKKLTELFAAEAANINMAA